MTASSNVGLAPNKAGASSIPKNAQESPWQLKVVLEMAEQVDALYGGSLADGLKAELVFKAAVQAVFGTMDLG